MTIDKVIANLYTCCKCKYQWTRRWNGNNGNGNVNGDQRAVTTTIPVTATASLPRLLVQYLLPSLYYSRKIPLQAQHGFYF